ITRNRRRQAETFERAREAFGAARAFPIRERYLLGTSDPLKRRSQTTCRPSGRPETPCPVRLGSVAARAAPVSDAIRWVRSVLPGRVPAGPVRSLGGSRPSLRPKPLGTGAKTNKGSY